MYRNQSQGQRGGGKNRFYQRKKICRFCVDNGLELNYKNPKALRQFITERGKIMPRRITGTCAKHQRQLSLAIKRSRQIALLPFVGRPMH